MPGTVTSKTAERMDQQTVDGEQLPVPMNAPRDLSLPRTQPRRSISRIVLLLGLLAGGTGGAILWWQHLPQPLPPGIAFANGRLEADEIDIANKRPGRVAAVLADEGDNVTAGQVLARMDSRDLEASLAQAEAQIDQARHVITEGQAELEQNRSQLKLAALELERARQLVPRGFETRQVQDQRQSQFDASFASYLGTEAKIRAATASFQAAMHNADVLRINIADDTLLAPKDGRIQYRLANIGEVLGAGGKVFTMLDLDHVYMDVFLPTAITGKTKLGDDAVIVLDARPDEPLPATVSFISSQNQFTPKMVETRSERDKLMFRIRVRIDTKWLRTHAGQVQSGTPGLAYIRFDPRAQWPVNLAQTSHR